MHTSVMVNSHFVLSRRFLQVFQKFWDFLRTF